MAMADSEGATRDEARISESKKSGNTPSASQVETFHFNTKTAGETDLRRQGLFIVGKSTKLQDERFTKLASLKALFDGILQSKCNRLTAVNRRVYNGHRIQGQKITVG